MCPHTQHSHSHLQRSDSLELEFVRHPPLGLGTELLLAGPSLQSDLVLSINPSFSSGTKSCVVGFLLRKLHFTLSSLYCLIPITFRMGTELGSSAFPEECRGVERGREFNIDY